MPLSNLTLLSQVAPKFSKKSKVLRSCYNILYYDGHAKKNKIFFKDTEKTFESNSSVYNPRPCTRKQCQNDEPIRRDLSVNSVLRINQILRGQKHMTHMEGCWLQAPPQEKVRTELSLQPCTQTSVLSRAQGKQSWAGEETRGEESINKIKGCCQRDLISNLILPLQAM